MATCAPSTTSSTTLSIPKRTDGTSAIVGAVVGVILGVLLIAVIVVLFVYYQFCRKVDPNEENSRESAFDFSNKTALGEEANHQHNKKVKKVKNKEKKIEEEEEERSDTPEKEKDEAQL